MSEGEIPPRDASASAAHDQEDQDGHESEEVRVEVVDEVEEQDEEDEKEEEQTAAPPVEGGEGKRKLEEKGEEEEEEEPSGGQKKVKLGADGQEGEAGESSGGKGQEASDDFAAPAAEGQARGGKGGAEISPSRGVLRMRGLPWSAKEEDIRSFFSGFDMPHNDEGGTIRIVLNREGRPSGEAFVVFSSPKEAERALCKDKERIGGRWIDLFKSSHAEMLDRTAPGRPAIAGSMPASGSLQVDDGRGVLRLRGIPFNATKQDLIVFFSDFGLDESRVFIASRPDGRPSGEAFAIFSSAEHAQEALKLDKQRLGDRWVDLFPSSMEQLYQRVGPAVQLATRPDAKLRVVVRMRGLPFSAEPADVASFFEAYGVADFGVFIMNGQDGRPTGEAYVVLQTEDGAARAVQERNKDQLGSRWIELFLMTKGDLFTATMRPIDRPRFGMAAASVPTCCKLRGLPFAVTEQDIFHFFSRLSVIGIFICKDQSSMMRPTGEGFVEFSSVDDCQHALSRNRERMSDRYVEVYACTKEDVLAEISGGGGGGRSRGGGYDSRPPPRGGGGYLPPGGYAQMAEQPWANSHYATGGGGHHPHHHGGGYQQHHQHAHMQYAQHHHHGAGDGGGGAGGYGRRQGDFGY